ALRLRCIGQIVLRRGHQRPWQECPRRIERRQVAGDRFGRAFLSVRRDAERSHDVRVLIRHVAVTLPVEGEREGMINRVGVLWRDEVAQLFVARACALITMHLARLLSALYYIEITAAGC